MHSSLFIKVCCASRISLMIFCWLATNCSNIFFCSLTSLSKQGQCMQMFFVAVQLPPAGTSTELPSTTTALIPFMLNVATELLATGFLLFTVCALVPTLRESSAWICFFLVVDGKVWRGLLPSGSWNESEFNNGRLLCSWNDWSSMVGKRYK